MTTRDLDRIGERLLHGYGVGRALHEEPGHIPGYYDSSDKKVFDMAPLALKKCDGLHIPAKLQIQSTMI